MKCQLLSRLSCDPLQIAEQLCSFGCRCRFEEVNDVVGWALHLRPGVAHAMDVSLLTVVKRRFYPLDRTDITCGLVPDVIAADGRQLADGHSHLILGVGHQPLTEDPSVMQVADQPFACVGTTPRRFGLLSHQGGQSALLRPVSMGQAKTGPPATKCTCEPGWYCRP